MTPPVMPAFYLDYANVLVFILVGALFAIANVTLVNRLLRPYIHTAEKGTTYECGEPAVGSAWVRFDMRFYTVALVFLIFDVEVAFLYPWALVFKELAQGSLFVLTEALAFLLVLAVGFAYVWVKGDLNWVTSTVAQREGRFGYEEEQ